MSTGIRLDPGVAAVHDLESTARLPILDVAAYEAQLDAELEPAIPVLREVPQAEALVAAPDAVPAPAPVLSAAAARSEAIAVPPAGDAAADEPGATSDDDHAETAVAAEDEADDAFVATVLRAPTTDERTPDWFEMRAGRDAAESRAAALQLELHQERARREDAEARAATLANIATRAVELEAIAARFAALEVEARFERERADSEAAARVAHRREAEFHSAQLVTLRAELERHRERELDVEARRGLWESLLRDTESQLSAELQAQRLVTQRALEREQAAAARLASAEQQAGAAATQLRAELEASLQSRAELLAEADGLRTERDARSAELTDLGQRSEALRGERDALREEFEGLRGERDLLRGERDALRTELDALRQQVMAAAPAEQPAAQPTPQLGTAATLLMADGASAAASAPEPAETDAARGELLRRVETQLRTTGERVSELETDLRAAEDQINRLEAELRAKSQRLEEVVRTNPLAARAETADRHRRRADDPPPRLRGTGGRGGAELGDPTSADGPFPSSGNIATTADGIARYLVLMDGDTEIVHVLGRRTTVGRGLDNDIRIDAKYVSRHHGVVLAGPAQTIVEDLRSTNGVMVNGRRVTRAVLRDGDVVHFGKSQFRFVERVRAR